MRHEDELDWHEDGADVPAWALVTAIALAGAVVLLAGFLAVG